MSQALLPSPAAEHAPLTCARVSSALGEPLLGTAPHAVGWLLWEHPGPWPSDAPWALLDPVVAEELERRCTRLRLRLAAVRRPTTRAGTTTACYVASSRPGRTWIRKVSLGEAKEILDLDLDAVAGGSAPAAGEPVTDPMFAVCTHGKRDACCAVHGNHVQRTLSALAPGQVWEATHLGGHRFAANVLALPEGLLYGRVDDDTAADLLAAHNDGQVRVPLLRGRSAHPKPAQAAEWFARRQTGLTAIDAIRIDHVTGDDGSWTVAMTAGGRPLTAVVERTESGCARMTSCADDVADPGRWRLVALD